MDTSIEVIDYEPQYEAWYVFIENRGFAGFDSPWTQSSPVEAYPDNILKTYGVLPEYRGRGVGSKLLETVKRWSQEQGYRCVYAFVIGDVRWDLHRFYRRAGYELVEQWLDLEDNQGRKSDVLIEYYWRNPNFLKQKIIDRGYIYCLDIT